MADKRSDLLADQQLAGELDQLDMDLDALKSGVAQQIQSSTVFFQSDNGTAYDWSGTLPQQVGGTTGQGMVVFSIEATAATMANLYANLNNKLYVGTSTTWYRPSDYLADIAAGHFGFQTFYQDVPSDTSSPATKQWIVSLLGNITSTAFLKFYVQALDHVTITVTRLV